jgi:hypothetical protein
MKVEVVVDGKQVEEFSAPEGFQLDRYAASCHRGAEIHIGSNPELGDHGAIVVEVFNPLPESDAIITTAEIARDLRLAAPDITYIGKYEEPAGLAIRRVVKTPLSVYKRSIGKRDNFLDDDETGAGHS